jgi:hypothetical protein
LEYLTDQGLHMTSRKIHFVSNPIVMESNFDASSNVSYLIANGLVGEPTAPVIGMAGATNINS